MEKSPVCLTTRILSYPVFMPYYHIVSNERLPHVSSLHYYKNNNQFLKDLDFLLFHFEPISLKDLIDAVENKKKIKKQSVLFTFDDGYAEQFSVIAPILYKKGIPAVFFITTNFIDNKELGFRNKASIIIDYLEKNQKIINKFCKKYLTDIRSNKNNYKIFLLSINYKTRALLDEIANFLGIDYSHYLNKYKPYLKSDDIDKLIKMGFFIGSHSMDHPDYSELSLNEQIEQTLESIAFLQSRFSLSYRVFSFPFSDNGIKKDFFKAIEGSLDLSFGNSTDSMKKAYWNLRRYNFERLSISSREFFNRIVVKEMLNKYFL